MQKQAQKKALNQKKPAAKPAPQKPTKEVKEVKKAPKAAKAPKKMEVEETEEDFDQIEEGLEEEVPEGGENIEALAAMLKSNSENKAKKREKTKKVLDFKFRTLELIQIFLKRTKNPSIFLQYVAPLVVGLRENEKDKAKDALVNKISALLKSYIDRQQSFTLNYSKELEECVAEVLFSARRVKSKKVQKVYKYLLKCILAIIFKVGLKTPIEGLVDRYQEALSDYVTKKSTELDAEYFKELVSKHKVIGVELLETLIQGANVKTCGGPKSDLVREECLNMLVSLVQSSSGNSEYLITKIIQHEAKLGDLMINTLENIEQIKNKKFAILQKYYNLFKLILNMLSNIKAQESVDEVLKQKAGALIAPYKNRITKRLKALEETEMAKTNPNFVKKLESMVEEVKAIN